MKDIQYQPYWKAYCKIKNLDLDHTPQSMIEYINWINEKWKQFEPDEFKRLVHIEHPAEFIKWLNKQTD